MLSWRSLSPSAPVLSGAAEWNGRSLKFQAVRTPAALPLKSDKRSLVPTTIAWRQFGQSLDENHVWNWLNNYPAQPAETKGLVWHIAIHWGTRTVESSGTNGYPSVEDVTKASASPVMFRRFLYEVDRLAGLSVETEGIYFAGFETSRFTPTTHGFKGDTWWLESNEDFNQRYRKFLPPGKADNRIAGPEVSARLRGLLLGPGAYGHLNQYPYEFIVEHVLDMKPAR
jgi:hypothetical protein